MSRNEHAHDHDHDPGSHDHGHAGRDHAHAHPPADFGPAFAIGIALNVGFVAIAMIMAVLQVSSSFKIG